MSVSFDAIRVGIHAMGPVGMFIFVIIIVGFFAWVIRDARN